ncbi:hypothetical protein ACLOJK_031207 [Asimina triloba]
MIRVWGDIVRGPPTQRKDHSSRRERSPHYHNRSPETQGDGKKAHLLATDGDDSDKMATARRRRDMATAALLPTVESWTAKEEEQTG